MGRTVEQPIVARMYDNSIIRDHMWKLDNCFNSPFICHSEQITLCRWQGKSNVTRNKMRTKYVVDSLLILGKNILLLSQMTCSKCNLYIFRDVSVCSLSNWLHRVRGNQRQCRLCRHEVLIQLCPSGGQRLHW